MERRVSVRYLAHFRDLTQKEGEDLDVEAATIRDLIVELDRRYPGLSEWVLDADGRINPRNPVVLFRPGHAARYVKSAEEGLENGDCLSFI